MLTVRTTPAFERSFDRSFDRVFDQLVGSLLEPRRASTVPAIDASWQDDAYVLTVDLPGVPAAAVAVEVAGTTLTLRVDTPTLAWQRSVRLGGRLDPDKVAASHVDGRLTVRIGMVDAPVARRIEILATPFETPAIDAASTEPDTPDQSSDTNVAG